MQKEIGHEGRWCGLKIAYSLRPPSPDGLRRGSLCSAIAKSGGAEGIRTLDLLDAIEARSQLRHGPTGEQRIYANTAKEGPSRSGGNSSGKSQPWICASESYDCEATGAGIGFRNLNNVAFARMVTRDAASVALYT